MSDEARPPPQVIERPVELRTKVWLILSVLPGTAFFFALIALAAWLEGGSAHLAALVQWAKGVGASVPFVTVEQVGLTVVLVIVLAVIAPIVLFYRVRGRHGRCEVRSDLLLFSLALRSRLVDPVVEAVALSEVSGVRPSPHGLVVAVKDRSRNLRLRRPLLIPCVPEEEQEALLQRIGSPDETITLRRAAFLSIYELLNGLVVVFFVGTVLVLASGELEFGPFLALIGIGLSLTTVSYLLALRLLGLYDEPAVLSQEGLASLHGLVPYSELRGLAGSPPFLVWEGLDGRRRRVWAGERLEEALRLARQRGAPSSDTPVTERRARRRELAFVLVLASVPVLSFLLLSAAVLSPDPFWYRSMAFNDQESQTLSVLVGAFDRRLRLCAVAVGARGSGPPSVAFRTGWGPWAQRLGPAGAQLEVDLRRGIVRTPSGEHPLEPGARLVVLLPDGTVLQGEDELLERLPWWHHAGGEVEAVPGVLTGLVATQRNLAEGIGAGRYARLTFSAIDAQGERLVGGVDLGRVAFVSFVGAKSPLRIQQGGFDLNLSSSPSDPLVRGGSWSFVTGKQVRTAEAPLPTHAALQRALQSVSTQRSSVAAIRSALAPPELIAAPSSGQ